MKYKWNKWYLTCMWTYSDFSWAALVHRSPGNKCPAALYMFFCTCKRTVTACHVLVMRDLCRTCRSERLQLTGSERRRPPTRAHSWSQSRGGCRDAALSGTLQTASRTQSEVINVAGGDGGLGGLRDSDRDPTLWLTDGFRKGIFKQSHAACLDRRDEVERATDTSRVSPYTASNTPSPSKSISPSTLLSGIMCKFPKMKQNNSKRSW